MALAATPTRSRAPRQTPGSNGNADAATRQRVIEAAVACILERGFYRASSNEIARRAGVTWGVIQHYFGTRERLMLAVLEHGAQTYVENLQSQQIEGADAEERIASLLGILSAHYGAPEYLADLQVLLNMDHDPRTSAEVRKIMHEVAARSNEHVRRLLREALGSAAKVPDLVSTIFLTIRGFGLSQQLLHTMSYDTVPPTSNRVVARQRRLLAQILAVYVAQAGDEA